MSSRRAKIWLKFASLALGMAICLWAKDTRNLRRNIDTASRVPRNPQATIKLQQKEIDQGDSWWSINVKYPQAEGADVFNVVIRQIVTAKIENFKKRLPKTAATGYPDYGAYLKDTYSAQVLKNGVISVLLQYEEYTPGAAHPWGTLASINYDTHARRVLALSDLFLSQSNYVSRLSKLAIDSLNPRQDADTHAIRQGAGPAEGNFKVFTLTDTDLTLHFQQYQVAAGAVSSEQVVIPLTRVISLLRKEYRPVR